MRLNDTLKNIRSEGLVSFHMPGHKNGRLLEAVAPLDYAFDITEIPGADNLHQPTGCIRLLEDSIRTLYDTELSKLLVNGSTSGILAMILGTLNPGEKLLLNRNAHQSVYHALAIGHVDAAYLYPEVDVDLPVVTGYDLGALRKQLDADASIKACLLTYPTYEGVCYDIEALIRLLKSRGILVLVDAAHGAHLLLDSEGPECVLKLGADVVVHSFHKTLPAMTQTACLHFSKGHRLSSPQEAQILWHLKALQTSSPSYVLMNSVAGMMAVVEKSGRALTRQLRHWITGVYKETAQLKALKWMRYPDQDITKFVLYIDAGYCSTEMNGRALEHLLRTRYGIQVEFSLENYCLLMASIANSESDFKALIEALCEIDSKMVPSNENHLNSLEHYFSPKWCKMPLYKAVRAPVTDCLVTEALGEIAGEAVVPYPPGIPLIVQGEAIDQSVVDYLKDKQEKIKILR